MCKSTNIWIRRPFGPSIRLCHPIKLGTILLSLQFSPVVSPSWISRICLCLVKMTTFSCEESSGSRSSERKKLHFFSFLNNWPIIFKLWSKALASPTRINIFSTTNQSKYYLKVSLEIPAVFILLASFIPSIFPSWLIFLVILCCFLYPSQFHGLSLLNYMFFTIFNLFTYTQIVEPFLGILL